MLRQCPQTTTFEEKRGSKRNRTEVFLLTSLTPYRKAKPVRSSLLHFPAMQQVCARPETQMFDMLFIFTWGGGGLTLSPVLHQTREVQQYSLELEMKRDRTRDRSCATP